MYKHLLIVLASTASCFCYANYEIFQGFASTRMDNSNVTNSPTLLTQTDETIFTQITTEETELMAKEQKVSENFLDLHTTEKEELKKVEPNASPNKTKINTEPSWSKLESSSFLSWRPELNLSELFQEENDTFIRSVSTEALKPSKFKCPEQEAPANIGPYEVPTQRDLVLHIRGTLTKMFNNYHEKTLYFLKDIRQATKSTKDVEKKCHGNKNFYRKCIKQVSQQCRFITKNLVISLEEQRQEVINFNEERICNLSEMKANPIQLIKMLAIEEASLEFALPGFLRLLHECSAMYCSKSPKDIHQKKPKHHVSDQELVIQYFMK